jgi:hypothetical protein
MQERSGVFRAAGCRRHDQGLTVSAAGWSDGRMLTVAAFAEQVAAGDTGRWQTATRRAAAWISPLAPVIDLGREIPLAQLRLQTLALLVYALAGRYDGDPASVPAGDVLDWLTEHQMPMPPEPPDPNGADIPTMMRRWRDDMDTAVDRCRRDLAALLAAMGHEVPEPGRRGLDRYSPDPVINVWLTLVDTDAQPPQQIASLLDAFRPPLLVLGLSALMDLAA